MAAIIETSEEPEECPEECPVCMESMCGKSVKLHCHHKMCSECIPKLPILKCPLCRRNILEESNVYKVIDDAIDQVLNYHKNNIYIYNTIKQSIEQIYIKYNKKQISEKELTVFIVNILQSNLDNDLFVQIIRTKTINLITKV